MLNLIRAKIKTMIKSNTFWLALLVLIFVFALCVIMQSSFQSDSDFVISNDTVKFGLYIAVDRKLTTLNDFVISFGITFSSLISGIFLASFVAQDYNCGYIKNYFSIAKGRKNLWIANIACAVFMAFISVVLSYILSLILGYTLIDGFRIDHLDRIIKTMIAGFLLLSSTFTFIICISSVFRSKVAGIVVLFILASGMILPFLEIILNMANISDLIEYTLSYQYAGILVFDADDAMKLGLISVVWALLYNIIGCVVITRQEL